MNSNNNQNKITGNVISSTNELEVINEFEKVFNGSYKQLCIYNELSAVLCSL